ncbi:MAG: hypothetical protein K9G41_12985 [Flavobacteriales bacterium]|nr:hypothetical protein [Flavobacteriales bacterium]
MAHIYPSQSSKYWLLFILAIIGSGNLLAQDGVLLDYTPSPPARNASAVMELRSTSQGFFGT